MSKFLNQITAESAGDGYWTLTVPLMYQSDAAKILITVPAGFKTNLYSGIPDGCGDRAAVVHDYIYATERFPRELCDAIFYEAMRVDGVPGWRAAIRYAGVRIFGSKYYGSSKA